MPPETLRYGILHGTRDIDPGSINSKLLLLLLHFPIKLFSFSDLSHKIATPKFKIIYFSTYVYFCIRCQVWLKRNRAMGETQIYNEDKLWTSFHQSFSTARKPRQFDGMRCCPAYFYRAAHSKEYPRERTTRICSCKFFSPEETPRLHQKDKVSRTNAKDLSLIHI